MNSPLNSKENHQKIGDWGWDEEPIYKGEKKQHKYLLVLERGNDSLE